MYFFGSEKSARIFFSLNFRQANSCYAIQGKVPARLHFSGIKVMYFFGSKKSSLVFFGCTI